MTQAPVVVRWLLIALWPVLVLVAMRSDRRSALETAVRDAPRVAVSGAPVAETRAGMPSELSIVNPFRLDRSVANRPDRRLVAAAGDNLAAPSDAAPKLTGVVWGQVPVAIVEGLPGAEGPILLRLGDQRFGVRVGRILPTGVVLVAKDTTWHLHLTAPAGVDQ